MSYTGIDVTARPRSSRLPILEMSMDPHSNVFKSSLRIASGSERKLFCIRSINNFYFPRDRIECQLERGRVIYH